MALETIHREKSIRLSVTLAVSLATLPVLSATNARAGIVSLDVAKVAAVDNLPLFYAGRWDYFTHFILDDFHGRPAAYAIVFSRPEAAAQNLQAIENSLTAAHERIASLTASLERIASDETKSGKERNKQIADIQATIRAIESAATGQEKFATVVTGATEDQPVVLKCHKGLPSLFVRQADALQLLRSARPGECWQITKCLYVGPFDDVFLAVPVAAAGASPTSAPTEDTVVVELRTGTIQNLPQARQAYEAWRQRRLQELDAATLAEREARRHQNQRQWNIYREKIIGGDATGTKTAIADPQASAPPAEDKRESSADRSPGPKAPLEGTKQEVPASDRHELGPVSDKP